MTAQRDQRNPFKAWTTFNERLTPYVSGQRRAFWFSDARFEVVAAGRRSGKSILARRKLVKKIFQHQTEYDDPRYFYAGPTQAQVKRLAWEDFKMLIPRELIRVSNESELYLRLWNGASLHLMGLDAPSRIEGTPWDGGIIDERADIKARAWDANIRPALSDRKGFCWHIGVPDMMKPANNEFKELFEVGMSGADPDWASFTWPSTDVLSELELEAARRRMPEPIYRQEYFASWESMPGRAYYEFVRTKHVKDENLFNPSLPIHISCDFNFGHHNWGIYQYNPAEGCYYAVNEIYLTNAVVADMCKKASDTIAQMMNASGAPPSALRDVVFFGDHSGDAKTAAATDSSWLQIKKYFNKFVPEYTNEKRSVVYRYTPAPLIADRVNLVNGCLRNADGDTTLYISSRCTNLIRDFEDVTMSLLYSDRKTALLSHASDNCGYYLDQFTRYNRAQHTVQKLKRSQTL